MKKKEDIKPGNRIRKIRSDLDLDQKEFSKKIGATVSALSNWENGINKPNSSMQLRIADLADISVDELLHGRKTIDLEEFRKQINKRIKAKAQFGAPTDLQIAIDIAEELAHEN